ncbi:hypothetical protein AB0F72_24685 [Actinoplanes sp. NPDC023936]|uniref:hypothetical protein n=1 Tax=Actinoplanes sp. NPDC023936 TaxID=3154910 RepID=UPI0033D16C5C
MIPISRLPLPAELDQRMTPLTEQIRVTEEGDRAKKARALWRRPATRATVGEPLRGLLRRMAPGVERCMYCGDNLGTDIDHYEPLARDPLRTFDWLNHLLACSHCNSHHKRDLFPVDERGLPMLIDPTAEDPFDHLLLSLSVGEYAALSEKGRLTIEVCGLNRADLARGRQQAYRVVTLCLREWGRELRDRGPCRPEALVRTIREQPFADVCQAMLRQVEMPGAETVFADLPDVAAVLRDPQVRDTLTLKVVTPY